MFPRCFQGNRRFGLVTKGLVSKSVSTQTKVFLLVRTAQVRKLVRTESPVLLAQVETALTSTDGGSEITHFPARVETASTKILYGSTMVFWNIPRARESGAAAGTRTDTASKPVSAVVSAVFMQTGVHGAAFC